MRNIILVLLIGMAIISNAQTYTLQEIENLSIKNYPLVKQAAILNQTAQLNIDNIKKALFPQLSINGQASYQSDVTSISLPIAGFKSNPLSKDQYKATAELQQIIYDGGFNKSQQAASLAGSRVEQLKNEIDIYKFKTSITQLYCSILFTNAIIDQIELINKDLDNASKKIATQYSNGLVFKNNVLQIKAQILKNNQKLAETKSSRKIVLDALSLLANIPFTENSIFQMPLDPTPDTEMENYQRPEFLLFEAQKQSIEKQKGLVQAKINPKLSAFVQTGYGKPGLNMLKNDFDWFSISGLKLQWSIGNFYTAKKEKEIIYNQVQLVQNEKDNFTLNNSIQLKQQGEEIAKFKSLMVSDKQLIEIREQIKQTSWTQLENGVISANDYLKEITEYDLAKQAFIQHQIQYIQSTLQYQLIKGKK